MNESILVLKFILKVKHWEDTIPTLTERFPFTVEK